MAIAPLLAAPVIAMIKAMLTVLVTVLAIAAETVPER